ncbi:hypothetical protein MTR67_036800 [Solanum verrucosum]|uniref:EF-hand domain-containing protein n=1 Tax=Solanum verrucosum TaxID=315347 RepID=A0AAF0ZN02_SOLVR|nr:hypothetical protein MTR67_036800 [Solanum verrucosum]
MRCFRTKKLKKPQFKEELNYTSKNLQKLEFEKENVKRLLKEYDKNGDRKLSKRELIEIFSSWFSGFKPAMNDHTYINDDEYYGLDDEIDALVKYATSWGYTIT